MDLLSAVDQLNPKWKHLLSKILLSKSFISLQTFLNQSKATIYPETHNIFAVYNQLNPEDIKVVILGQDPYHDVNQAHGLAFSVENTKKLPPSLKNIFKELSDDLSLPIPTEGNLSSWINQGVFLLNTVLTVEAHKPNSHKNRGWEAFTDETLKIINDINKNVVFVLWGANAQKKASMIDTDKHLILSSAHPSPLSVYRGFWKSKPFSKINAYLREHGKEEIRWIA